MLGLLILGITSCDLAQSSSDSDNDKPNIVVLLVDDAGYADFGFNGSQDLETPNIDKLAQNGVVFSDAHVSATVCGPSRAGLITGRYQQRFGFECNPPEEYSGVALDEETIADALKNAGYVTSGFGKWHLGNGPEYRPNARGFDYYWGFLAGGRSYFPNSQQDQPGSVHSIRENDSFTEFEGYLTDVLGDKAVDFIDTNKDKPFFMYWSTNAPHTPMEATEADLERYEGHPRQVLAAMTWAFDRAVGEITDKLEKENLLDNTLIFFLSDNGGAHNNQSSNEPLKGFKGNKYEGGMRVPFVVHWPSKIEGGIEFDGLTSALDIFPTSLDAAEAPESAFEKLDGVSLLPFLSGEKEGDPHEELFWRKDQAAAARVGDYKLIRVERLGYRLYNLEENLDETNNLTDVENEKFELLKEQIGQWEDQLIEPLWTEGHEWDTVTWMIHEDYYHNREVRVKNPGQLNQYKSKQ
ncbi:MAG: sulfatase-like hydrolase/transferase [Bacteroidota bacterium]